MKVLLLCMTFAAMSLAMPVAEKTPEAPAVLPEADIKSEETKPEAQPAPTDLKSVESGSENSAPVTAAKSSPVEPTPEVTKPEEPIVKSDDKDFKAAESEKKLEDSNPPEVKLDAPGTSEGDEAPATVKEVPTEVSAKSALPVENIDVIDAMKSLAKIADDITDPAAIMPTSESKAVENKQAEPTVVEQKEALSTELPKIEESKAIESKPEEKSASVAADSVPPAATTPVDATEAKPFDNKEDILRVVRDTVADKVVEVITAPKKDSVEESKAAPKQASEEASEEPPKQASEEVSTEELKVSTEAPKNEVEAPESTKPEPSPENNKEPIKELKEPSTLLKEGSESVPVEAENPQNASDIEISKPQEKPQGDAPAPASASAPDSSEESSEEKKNTKSDEKSSEESDEIKPQS